MKFVLYIGLLSFVGTVFCAELTKKAAAKTVLSADEQRELNNKLFKAIDLKDSNLVQSYIDQGADVDIRDEMNFTPLIVAAGKGDSKSLEILIDEQADVHAANKCGVAALQFAARDGHVDCVKKLISAGALDKQNLIGETALLWAVSRDHPLSARELIKAGVDCDTFNQDSHTPLMVAAINGHTDCMKDLIALGDSEFKDTGGNTALHLACGHNVSSVKKLIELGANKEAQNDRGMTPLMCATYRGQVECVQYLIEQGVDKDAQNREGMTALHLAVFHDDTGCLKILYTAEADPEIQGGIFWYTPLALAAHNDNANSLQMLIQLGVRIGALGWSYMKYHPLSVAARQNSAKCLNSLFKTGIDPNMRDHSGVAPLFHVASGYHVVSLKTLIKASANLGMTSKGETALHIAAGNGNTGGVVALLTAGADAGVINVAGESPLIRFALSKSENQLFIAFRSDKIIPLLATTICRFPSQKRIAEARNNINDNHMQAKSLDNEGLQEDIAVLLLDELRNNNIHISSHPIFEKAKEYAVNYVIKKIKEDFNAVAVHNHISVEEKLLCDASTVEEKYKDALMKDLQRRIEALETSENDSVIDEKSGNQDNNNN